MGKIILGIDPGSLFTGYGVLEERTGRDVVCVDFGVLKSSSKVSLAERLLCIGSGLNELFKKYAPQAVAIEKTFFAKNADSAIKLGHARGVCLYEAARAKVPVFEYNATEVKMNIVGHGRAEKSQVQLMVRRHLNLNDLEMDKFDMSDALAIALCHCRISSTTTLLREREILT